MFPERTTQIDPSGRRSISITNVLAREPVLQDFLLERRENASDTHVAQLSVSRRESRSDGSRDYLFAMADADAREDAGGALRVVDVSSIEPPVTTATLSRGRIRDTATLEFDTRPAGAVPLLAGFSFTKTRGGDHHLREVSVLPAPGGYSVRFRDDSPGDDRYDAAVDVVFVPEANVIAQPPALTFDDAIGSIDLAREAGQAALRGFSLRFLQTDRHVFRIGVALSADRIRMTLRPRNPNRHFQGSVEYALLQAP